MPMTFMHKYVLLSLAILTVSFGCRRGTQQQTELMESISVDNKLTRVCGRLIFREGDDVVKGWWLRADAGRERFRIDFAKLDFLQIATTSPLDACVFYDGTEVQNHFIADVIIARGIVLASQLQLNTLTKFCGYLSHYPVRQAPNQTRKNGLADDPNTVRREDTLYLHTDVNLSYQLTFTNSPHLDPNQTLTNETAMCVYSSTATSPVADQAVIDVIGFSPSESTATDTKTPVTQLCGRIIYRTFPEGAVGYWLREAHTARPYQLDTAALDAEQLKALKARVPIDGCVGYTGEARPGSLADVIQAISIKLE